MRRTQVAAAVLAILLVAAAMVAFVSWRASLTNMGENRDVGRAQPHCGGEPSTLPAAFAETPYSAELPEVSVAKADSLVGTWDCPGTRTLLEFSTGATLNLNVNAVADPPAAWKSLAESNPKIYSVGEVNGVPASFIDPDGDPNDDAEGGVTFVVDGVYVSVGGDGTIPLGALVTAAEKLVITAK